MPRRAAVVGGGWSGIAAALTLADAGRQVTVLDAAPQLGGRARRVEVALGDRSYPLDNGQHLLIGAYRDTLALMRRVGVDPDRVFLRQPFALRYPDGFRLQAAALPAPLHLAAALLTARGLPWSARLAMAWDVERWKRAGWTTSPSRSAADLVARQPRVLIERVWEPLCVAALNVRLQDACAQVFLTVLRDSLGADAAASDLLLPRVDLSALLPDGAATALAERGVTLRLRTVVAGMQPVDRGGWHLLGRDGTPLPSAPRDDAVGAAFDAIVLALPPDRAADLLAPLPALGAYVAQLQQVASAPIATVYLRYDAGTRLPHPVSALVEQPAQGDFGQWVFDRGTLDPRCDGVVSVVVSASGPHQALGRDAICAGVAAQLSRALGLPPPLAMKLIEDKRATIVPAPGFTRPPVVLPLPGLYLAGDAADSAYPSTIEGSVRSGLAAARALLAA